ncbi:MAG: Uncharacterized protein FD135_4176 [Comamonadaceae bacterium]|nr:MAG: Uncharacterized protein FD135_4176 [Comamonadaceae bacterium]
MTSNWAYPRSRGGTAVHSIILEPDLGLSPLARGNLHNFSQVMADHGPIPARAGEPTGRYYSDAKCRAYPRSRGGTKCVRRVDGDVMGLSPLARGNRGNERVGIDKCGPIPARAGEPLTPNLLRCKRKQQNPFKILKNVCRLATPGQPHSVHLN